jgi:hypothetical protein
MEAETAAAPANVSGWGISNISLYSGFTLAAVPDLNYNLLSGAVPAGSFALAGGAAALGWRRAGQRTSLALSYLGSYNSIPQYSEWNAMNHSLSLGGSRQVGNRWGLAFSLAGAADSLNQFLFTPPVLSRLADVPASFEELSGAILAGNFTNDQLASVLTGAPMLEAPSRAMVYGNRVLNVSTTASLTYSRSPRLSLHFGAGGTRSQDLGGEQGNEAAAGNYLLARSTQANANVGFTYSLTPRTTLGMEASASRAVSSLQDAYTSTGTVSLGRTLSRRWFVEGSGGVSNITPVRQRFLLPQALQYVAGGNVGYRTYAHTLLGSVGRTAADSYGLGAGHTISTGAAWRWSRPGASWALSASLRQQEMQGAQALSLSSWIVSGGVTRTLSRYTAAQISYTFLQGSGVFAGAAQNITLHSIRLSFAWIPARVR